MRDTRAADILPKMNEPTSCYGIVTDVRCREVGVENSGTCTESDPNYIHFPLELATV